MKYHALFAIFEKAAKFELSSAENCRWRFKGKFRNHFLKSQPQCVMTGLIPRAIIERLSLLM